MTTIDEYIAAQPEEHRALLQTVREAIHGAAPEAAELISYGMPAFKQKKILIYFGLSKRHIGIYPHGNEAIEHFAERLKGYKTSKGAIQFPLDKPLDLELLRDIVRFRLERVTEAE